MFVNLYKISNMKRLILHIILIFSSFSLHSQSGIDISFGVNDVQLPDTVTMGDTIYVNCWIVNQGGDVLSGQILLKAALQDTSGSLTNIRTVGGQGPVFIYPGDSIQFIQNFLYEVVTNQNYNLGDNIVVIWPKLASPVNQTNEYAYNNVFVKQNPTSIQSLFNNYFDEIIIYPNPVNSIVNFDENIKMDKLKIFSIDGKLILEINISEKQFDVSKINEGNYIFQLFFQGNLIETKKVIIQK